VSPTPSAVQSDLPADISNVIRKDYDADTRYVDGAIDLNADGKAEVVVYVVGPMACGTGGCPTMVFTSLGAGCRLVSTISVTNPPIRVSATSTSGWRNLIVHVSGGGTEARDVANQRTWIASRNRCAKETDMRACVESSYQRRLIECRFAADSWRCQTK
jgi:hypothetical protein